jgi:hypothetical protein
MAGEGIDYEALAKGVEQMREAVKAMVAGLIADGFSDEQARDIVAGLWRSTGRPADD